LLLASWDLPGGRLIDVVTTMDRLRSPGGCPWDAEQTHASLAKYLLEEAYETLEAIEDDDLGALREELGDLLLQVVFHARLAEEASAAERWSIDDVAADLVAKLVRRHPHVFGDVEVAGAGEVAANWESIKAAEKGRRSVAEGVPLGQPALALASALVSRAARNGIAVAELLPAAVGSSPEAAVAAAAEHAADSDEPVEAVGELLLRVVLLAAVLDVDPEAALRGAARRLRERLLRVPGEAAGSEVEGPAVVGPDTFPAARVVPDRRLAPGAPSDAPTAGALDSAPSIGERRLADVIDPAAPPRDDGGLTGPNTEVPEFPG
jgi:XTP/dITP diphosphohydrolase